MHETRQNAGRYQMSFVFNDGTKMNRDEIFRQSANRFGNAFRGMSLRLASRRRSGRQSFDATWLRSQSGPGKKSLAVPLCQQLFRHAAIMKTPQKANPNENESHPPFNLLNQFGKHWPSDVRYGTWRWPARSTRKRRRKFRFHLYRRQEKARSRIGSILNEERWWCKCLQQSFEC